MNLLGEFVGNVQDGRRVHGTLVVYFEDPVTRTAWNFILPKALGGEEEHGHLAATRQCR